MNKPYTFRYKTERLFKVKRKLSAVFVILYLTKPVRTFLICLSCLAGFILFVSDTQHIKKQPNAALSPDKRNLSHYLTRYDYQGRSYYCKSYTNVIVSVISAPSNYEAREAIRKSWGKEIPTSWTLIFFTGILSSKYQIKLIQDFKQEEDLIELNCIDSYQNLTIKVGLLFEWVKSNCNQARYLLKVDDDVYINTKNMKQLIEDKSTDKKNKENNDLGSDISRWYTDKSGTALNYVAAGYVYERVYPDRNPTSKWYLDLSLYKNLTFPKFLSGTSYLITTNLLSEILRESNNMPLINLEDVYYTGLIMVNKMKLILTHLNGWSNFRPRWNDPCYFKSLLTAHGLKPTELIDITQRVNTINSEHCKQIYSKILMKLNEYLTYYLPRIAK